MLLNVSNNLVLVTLIFADRFAAVARFCLKSAAPLEVSNIDFCKPTVCSFASNNPFTNEVIKARGPKDFNKFLPSVATYFPPN